MWLLQVDEHNKVARINGIEIRQGDFISLNGSTGEIIRGKQPLAASELAADMNRWVRSGVWAAGGPLVGWEVLWGTEVLATPRVPATPAWGGGAGVVVKG